MLWKLTKCGHSCLNSGENVGSGRSCVVVHVKSLPTPLGVEAKRLAVFSGSAFPQVIKAVKVSVIYGKLINWSSQQRRIIVLEKQKDKPITWSDGTTNSDNRALALFEKLYPFQNLTSCMKS